MREDSHINQREERIINVSIVRRRDTGSKIAQRRRVLPRQPESCQHTWEMRRTVSKGEGSAPFPEPRVTKVGGKTD